MKLKSAIGILVCLYILSCKTTTTNNPVCGTLTLQDSTAENGTIIIKSPVGAGLTYKMGSGAYQATPEFTGLVPGTYVITAKNSDGCTGEVSVVLSADLGCNSATMDGVDTGYHYVYIDALNPGLEPLRDSLNVSHTGNAFTINSKILGRNITGSISSADCNALILDSVIFAAGDTLRVNSTILGTVKIWNVRAGGSGTLASNGLTTKIEIAKGNTNISSPINLTNLNGLKLNLRGSFTKR